VIAKTIIQAIEDHENKRLQDLLVRKGPRTEQIYVNMARALRARPKTIKNWKSHDTDRVSKANKKKLLVYAVGIGVKFDQKPALENGQERSE